MPSCYQPWREAVVYYHSARQSRASMRVMFSSSHAFPYIMIFLHGGDRFTFSSRCMKVGKTTYAFQTITGYLIVPQNEILLFRFNEGYWQIMLTNRPLYTLRLHVTAKKILEVSSSYIQIRQDCIINVEHIVFIEHKSLQCFFRNPFEDVKIVVSRRFYVHLREVLNII